SFRTFGEAVDFFDQIFEHLYPNGFHPQFPSQSMDLYYMRPLKYYFIDFGISIKFEPGQPRTAIPIRGGRQDCARI
ncbi:hypothetical protein B0H10DRAFT_2002982, partial [Mycena sp. CBHHK59/15]